MEDRPLVEVPATMTGVEMSPVGIATINMDGQVLRVTAGTELQQAAMSRGSIHQLMVIRTGKTTQVAMTSPRRGTVGPMLGEIKLGRLGPAGGGRNHKMISANCLQHPESQIVDPVGELQSVIMVPLQESLRPRVHLAPAGKVLTAIQTSRKRLRNMAREIRLIDLIRLADRLITCKPTSLVGTITVVIMICPEGGIHMEEIGHLVQPWNHPKVPVHHGGKIVLLGAVVRSSNIRGLLGTGKTARGRMIIPGSSRPGVRKTHPGRPNHPLHLPRTNPRSQQKKICMEAGVVRTKITMGVTAIHLLQTSPLGTSPQSGQIIGSGKIHRPAVGRSLQWRAGPHRPSPRLLTAAAKARPNLRHPSRPGAGALKAGS